MMVLDHHCEAIFCRAVVNDELWELVEPLIPPRPPARRGRTGRTRVPDRAVLAGIVFVLGTGIS